MTAQSTPGTAERWTLIILANLAIISLGARLQAPPVNPAPPAFTDLAALAVVVTLLLLASGRLRRLGALLPSADAPVRIARLQGQIALLAGSAWLISLITGFFHQPGAVWLAGLGLITLGAMSLVLGEQVRLRLQHSSAPPQSVFRREHQGDTGDGSA